MREELKNIPYWLYDFLSVISAILTIVTAIIAAFKAVVTVRKMEDGTYVVSYDTLLLFLVIVITLCFIVCLIKVLKYLKLVRNMRKEFSDNYYLFLHDFRNVYFDILRQHKNSSSQSKQIRIKALTKDTQTFLIDSLDFLCNILTQNTGCKVSACIKLIENTGDVTNIDKERATVITFCRSRNSAITRKANDEKENKSIRIKKNTDY